MSSDTKNKRGRPRCPNTKLNTAIAFIKQGISISRAAVLVGIHRNTLGSYFREQRRRAAIPSIRAELLTFGYDISHLSDDEVEEFAKRLYTKLQVALKAMGQSAGKAAAALDVLRQAAIKADEEVRGGL